MPARKVLCCADLHLGRSSSGISFPDGLDVSSVGAWGRIVDAAVDGQADVVCIAGDIFDGMGSFNHARGPFRLGLERLTKAGIPTVAVAGNHDHEALRRFASTQAGNNDFRVLGLKNPWESVTSKGIQFSGWSFPAAEYSQPAIKTFEAERFDGPRVGLLHGDAYTKVSKYHPIDLTEISRHKDAWILGHIHKPDRFAEARVVYPGSPQAFDFGPGERDAHGFYWLHIDGPKMEFSELVPCSTVEYVVKTVSIQVGPDQDPNSLIEMTLESECNLRTSASSVLQSVQLRAVVELIGSDKVPQTSVASPSGNHGFEILQVVPILPHDVWAETESSGRLAEIARLLVAGRAESGIYQDRSVLREWIDAFERMMERVSDDLKRLWDASVLQTASGFEEHSIMEPSLVERREEAKLLLLRQLETESTKRRQVEVSDLI